MTDGGSILRQAGRLTAGPSGHVFKDSLAAAAAAWLLVTASLMAPSPLAVEQADESAPPEVPPEVQAILSQPSESSQYTAEERCLPLHRIRSVTALDGRHVVFRLGRKELYLVQFRHRCPGLGRNDPVAYETLNGMSVCTHDAIRGLLRYGFGDNRLGPPCGLPGFQQISDEQLDALKAALRGRR